MKTSDGLFNCALKIPDGSSITIPMREDGMINATMLCKAHGKKRLDNYMRSSKEFIEELKTYSLNLRKLNYLSQQQENMEVLGFIEK